MTEDEMRRAAWEAAVENLVSLNLSLTMLTMGYSDEQAKVILQGIAQQMRAETFPGADAATSDMIAAEIEDATIRMTDAALDNLTKARARLSRQGG